MINKSFKRLFFTLVLFVFFMQSIIVHAEIKDNQIVEATKVWTIKFNKEIVLDEVNRQSIIVKDSKGNIVTGLLNLGGQGNESILVNPPSGGYIAGEKYVLNIGKDIHSKNEKKMKADKTMNFSIVAPRIELSKRAGAFVGILNDSVSSTGDIQLNLNGINCIKFNVANVTGGTAFACQTTTIATDVTLNPFEQASLITDDYDGTKTVNDKLASTLGKGAAVKVTFGAGSTNAIPIIDEIQVVYTREIYDSNRTITKDVISISDNTNITSKFTDVNFKAEVYKLIGKTSPSPIFYSDVKNITDISVVIKNISSLSGIEYFIKLTNLNCYGNNLTILDLSKNTELTILNCCANKLITLDVSKNIALTELWCDGNKLTTLDISKNNALTILGCSSNKLTTLDVSKNTKLTDLVCWDNQLTVLDVTKTTALTWLNCSGNKILVLDVSKNIALTDLDCSNNQITSLYSIKNTWDTGYYKTQYTDSTHTTTTDSLVITIKK